MKNIITTINILVLFFSSIGVLLGQTSTVSNKTGFFDAVAWDVTPAAGYDINIEKSTINVRAANDGDTYGVLTVANISNSASTFTVDAGVTITFGNLIFSGKNNTVNVSGNITVNSITVASIGNTINVFSGGSLTVLGSITVTGAGPGASAASIDIANNGTVSVTGTVTLQNPNSSANIDGNLSATGGIVNNGVIDVGLTGVVTVPPPATLSGSGDVNNSGIIDANYTGTGTVTGNNFLPIELTSFTAKKVENAVTIYWTTATEENNNYFTIERSADGASYKVIALVGGAGNSSTALNYSYTDNDPLVGVAYYRLKQTDYNGESETFDPVSVVSLNEAGISVGPNPATNYLIISVDGKLGSNKVDIYNLIGAKVKTIELINSVSTIDVSDLPRGSYMVILSANSSKIVKRVLIQ